MHFSQRLALFTLLSLSSFAAHAQKTSAVLPKGIFRARVVTIVGQTISGGFDSQGRTAPVGAPLSQTVTAGQMAQKNAQLGQLYAGLNAFQPGLGDSLFQVDLRADASVEFQEHIAALEYGISDKLAFGIIVPVSRRQYSAKFSADLRSQTAAVRDRVAGVQPLADGVMAFESQLPTTRTFEQNLFLANGYEVPGDFRTAGLGDTEIGLKYQPYKGKYWSTAFTAGTRAPTTTHKRNWANVLDRSLGDEQWDLAFENVQELQVLPTLTLGAAARYTVQLAADQERPLLRNGQSGLPNLNDKDTFQTVRRDLGDYLETEAFVSKTWFAAWTTAAVYQYSLKARDRVSGPAGFQTASVESNSNTSSQRYELGLGYSTIPAFAAKRFAVPFEAKLAYNSILKGENTPRNDYARMDLIVYF
jgi:hypothetical protein